MALSLTELANLVRYFVGDTDKTTYVDSLVYDAINFSIKDYARKTGATYTEVATTTGANGLVAIDSTIIPNGYLRINRVIYSRPSDPDTTIEVTPAYQLVESTFNFESMKSPTWQTTSITTANTGPKRWILRTGGKIQLTPLIGSWNVTPAPVVTIGYVEKPVDLTDETPIAVTAITAGASYRIAAVGTTNFVAIGASADTVGVEFVASAVGTGTGTVYQIVDMRIPEVHQEHLKYAAAAWLMLLDGDTQDFGKADAMMNLFNQMIGYSDPVLEAKLSSTRTEGKREI